MLVDRSITLASGTIAAAEARRFVRSGLVDAGAPGLVDHAVLLASELVTNALLHAAATAIGIRLVADAGGCRVEVADTSAALPATKHYSPMASTGRGLQMVERLALRWGTVPQADGKTVWFELGRGAPGGARRLAGSAGTA
jgi:anti-sigma regulatory factor (Ser/Thr protein kinase)